MDGLPGPLWRMIRLVHDTHIGKLVLEVRILTQTVC